MMIKKIGNIALISCMAVLFFAVELSAQTIVTGGFSGTITDPTGATVPGATLSLVSRATGSTASTVSGANGEYTFSLLKPDEYTLTVTKNGFKTYTRTVPVLLGQNLAVSIPLELGAGTTTVEVSEAPALLQTENANISTTFDTRTVQNIPNPGNDVTYIAQTAPGISMNTSSGNGYGNFSAFGLPGTSNLFTINGNDYNDPFLNLNNSGASNLLLGSNEIQEVSVISNAYTGQYGRQAGAQVDYATKSGGNAYHGNAVYYYNSGGMNSSDYFNGYEREVNNQWAASFGGPVIKNKLFFFANTEGLRYTLASGGGQIFYPTTAFENF